MKRFSPDVVLLLVLGLAIMIGCTSSATKDELELTTYDPAQDHQKIAAYYNHEAAKLRQAVEEMSVRITVYERLFGPTSDWVTGTRLLAQSYEDAAQEYERKARIHSYEDAAQEYERKARIHLERIRVSPTPPEAGLRSQ